MEALLEAQKVEIDELCRLIRNYKADGPTRKTKKYLQDRQTTFPECFRTINENNDKMLELYDAELHATQPYFANKTFQQVERLYLSTIEDIETRITQLINGQPDLTKDDDIIQQPSTSNFQPTLQKDENNEKYDDAETTFESINMDNTTPTMLTLQYDELMNLLTSANDLNDDASRGQITTYLAMLNETWTLFKTEINKERLAQRATGISYPVIMTKFMRTTGKLNDLIVKPQSKLNDKFQDVQFSLPRIKLPDFNGKPSEWKGFIALFDRMIHNNGNLDKGIKIEYLKTCVRGSAAKIINHLDPTPENYQTCYDLIKKRYENKRELLSSLVENICQLPKLRYEDSDALKTLHDTVYESLMAAKNLGVTNEKLLDFLICHILLKKLDNATIVHYECQLNDVREPQSLSDFLKYIENRFMALQAVGFKGKQYVERTNPNTNTNTNTNFTMNTNSTLNKAFKCLQCEETHAIYKCPTYLKQNSNERFEFAKQKRLCMNCLSPSHKTHECKSKFKCKKCNKNHNTLLHLEQKNMTQRSNVAKVEIDEVTHVHANVSTHRYTSVLLATAMIGVYAKNGDKILLRALIDQGSQSAFISETAAQTLGLSRISINAKVAGIGAKTQFSRFGMKLSIIPRFASDFIIDTDAIILPKLTHTMNEDYNKNDFQFINNLTLADPSFLSKSEIDIILGASEYAQIIKNGLMKSDKNIIAQNTELGWIISGSFNKKPLTTIITLVSNVELEEKLRAFFAPEEFEKQDEITEEEAYCEKLFKETTYKNENNKFVITLPFKNGIKNPDLGDSRKCAIATQLQLERRFEKRPSLREEYSNQIREAINLGHIEEVRYEPTKNCHYLPHHCVFKDSTTTAMRIVYNASQKTTNGKSLNEQLAIGKTNQKDLTSLLIQFRIFRYAITADIEKMYKQILLNDEQIDLQRFIFRFSPNEPFREFRLKTVTFGFSNAPYIAIRMLEELAYRVKERYPLASSIISNCMYMDDVIGGCHTFDELHETYDQLKKSFESAGLNLRKWCSNSHEFLRNIAESDRETKALSENVKALGISWSSTNDMFTYDFSIPMDTVPTTKRQLTSEIASMFDPLGWISPVIISAKNILQHLWFENIDWDAQIPQKYVNKWLKIKSELQFIYKLNIPRFINYTPDTPIELHGFSDASELGYAAVIYLVNKRDKTANILVAKARVSPLKETKNNANVTIPRLELSAALLLAQLVNKVITTLPINFDKIRLWSDSRIVLDWLYANPKKYKVFIASRIEKINKLVDTSYWSHVRSEENAADCASRGVLPSELANHQLWWNGPKFLVDETLEPPRYKPAISELTNTPESNDVTCNVVINNKKNEHQSILPNVSTYTKLKRIIAFVQRFKFNCKNTLHKKNDALSLDELEAATLLILKTVQNEAFKTELSILSKNGSLPRSNKFCSLSPFLDKNGLARVGGRIQKSDLPYDAKHQILLPNRHAITRLIIEDCHKKSIHGGPKLTESLLRQKFWICNSQRTIKSVLRECVSCFRANPKPMQQYMANLPEARVKPDKPFAKTAVDYTGAIRIKIKNGRGYHTNKAYIAIFVCMSTRAIHIEAVSDMTAEAFIAAFHRLVARRGVVRHLYSDNGTNFVKANKILQENALEIDAHHHEKICNELAKNGTRWHFSPPGAPHFNGLAEAAVKSVKTHLKKTIGDTALTFEELSTLLTQIEASVNSRPLYPLSSDPNDVGVLTPGHFLVGESLITPPEPCHVETKATWLTRWQKVQQMAQHFWTRWSTDVINQAQVRAKWQEKKTAPNLNDLVMIRDENLPPSQWQMGRVIALHPGEDNLTRVVTIRNKSNIFKRPITKICPLPHNNNEIIDETNVNNARVIRKPKTNGVLPIMVAMLAICTTLSHQTPISVKPYEITEYTKAPGLYFEKLYDVHMTQSSWSVVSHLNLQTLHDEFEAIQSNLTLAREFCHRKIKIGSGCRQMIEYLKKKLDRLSERNVLLFENLRSKREINVPTLHTFGDVLSDIFGVCGSKFASQIDGDISMIFRNEEHILELMKNKTSVLESALEHVKFNENEIRKHSDQLNQLVAMTKNHSQTSELEDGLLHFISYLTQVINEYEHQQSMFIDIITDSKRDHISHELFTLSQINRQVEIIAKAVGTDFRVPKSYEVYSVSTIKVYIIDTQFIFKLSIPLFETKKFKLYSITTVPTKWNTDFLWIKNDHKYLLTSSDHQIYQFIENMNDCSPYQDNKALICRKPNQWFTTGKQNCAWSIFNHLSHENCTVIKRAPETFFVSLKNNKFLYVLDKPIKLTILCKDTVFHDSLAGEGMLALDQHCSLTGEHVHLTTVSRYQHSEIVVPQLDLKKWSLPNTFSDTLSGEVELGNLETQASNLTTVSEILTQTRENMKLEHRRFNYHNVHHYSMTYVILLVLIIYFIVKYFKPMIIKNRRAAATRPEPLPRQISMPYVVEELE